MNDEIMNTNIGNKVLFTCGKKWNIPEELHKTKDKGVFVNH